MLDNQEMLDNLVFVIQPIALGPFSLAQLLAPGFMELGAIARPVTLVALWLIFVGLLAEWVYRRTAWGAEASRKVVHIGAGNVILLAWWLHIPQWIGLVAAIGFSAIAFLSYHVPMLPSVNGIGRKSLGTFFYAISIGVLLGLFWPTAPQYTAIGILVMAWGDGLAAIVGQRFGAHPYRLWQMQKSWEGSLAMAVVSFGVTTGILMGVQGAIWQTWAMAGMTAAIATGLEAFSKFGIDNLTVPIGSAVLCFALGEWLF
jgi:phytol kinase